MSFLAENMMAMAKVRPGLAEMLYAQAQGVTIAPYSCEGKPPVDAWLKTHTGETVRLYGDDLSWDERLSVLFESWRFGPFQPSDHSQEFTLILLGFGLGHVVRRVLQHLGPERKLAVYEPDAHLLYTAFIECELQDILSDPRVNLLSGVPPERAVEVIGRDIGWGRFLYLPYRILHLPYIERLYPEVSKRFADMWRSAIDREGMFLRSRLEQGEQVVRHTTANISRLLESPGIGALFQQLPKRPAMLIGAGPSLTQNLDELRNAPESLLLVCVNTAYPVLRKAGIAPHLVVSLDHQPRNVGSFKGRQHDPRTYLIADPRIDPGILSEFENRTMFLSWHTTTEEIGSPAPPHQIPLARGGGNSLYHWLQQRIGEKGTITGTGSVAVAAFQLLSYWGCEPIALLGMDLAFPDEQTYAAGTVFDDAKLPRDDKIAYWVPDTAGRLVGTSSTLNLYRQLFEHEIKRFGKEVWNTGLGGAHIQGTTPRALKSFWTLCPAGESPDMSIMFDKARQCDLWQGQRVSLKVALRVLRDELSDLRQRTFDYLRELETSQQNGKPIEHSVLESQLQTLRNDYPSAHFVLNELLQRALVDYDRNYWESLSLPPQQRDQAKYLRVKLALEAISVQAHLMHQLLEL